MNHGHVLRRLAGRRTSPSPDVAVESLPAFAVWSSVCHGAVTSGRSVPTGRWAPRRWWPHRRVRHAPGTTVGSGSSSSMPDAIHWRPCGSGLAGFVFTTLPHATSNTFTSGSSNESWSGRDLQIRDGRAGVEVMVRVDCTKSAPAVAVQPPVVQVTDTVFGDGGGEAQWDSRDRTLRNRTGRGDTERRASRRRCS